MPVKVGAAAFWDRTTKPYLATKLSTDIYRRCSVHMIHDYTSVSEQMDAIEADFGRDFAIGRVITIVEVETPDGNVNIRVRAGQYPWVALGMLDFAKKSVEAQMSG
jgi:hypothetical protein